MTSIFQLYEAAVRASQRQETTLYELSIKRNTEVSEIMQPLQAYMKFNARQICAEWWATVTDYVTIDTATVDKGIAYRSRGFSISTYPYTNINDIGCYQSSRFFPLNGKVMEHDIVKNAADYIRQLRDHPDGRLQPLIEIDLEIEHAMELKASIKSIIEGAIIAEGYSQETAKGEYQALVRIMERHDWSYEYADSYQTTLANAPVKRVIDSQIKEVLEANPIAAVTLWHYFSYDPYGIMPLSGK